MIAPKPSGVYAFGVLSPFAAELLRGRFDAELRRVFDERLVLLARLVMPYFSKMYSTIIEGSVDGGGSIEVSCISLLVSHLKKVIHIFIAKDSIRVIIEHFIQSGYLNLLNHGSAVSMTASAIFA